MVGFLQGSPCLSYTIQLMARSNDTFRHVNPVTNKLWTRPELWRDNTRLKSELETVKAQNRELSQLIDFTVITPKQYVNDLKRRSQIVLTELKSLSKDIMWVATRVREILVQVANNVVEASHRI
jgi:hypothetical protein